MDVCECSQVPTQPQIRVRLKKLNSSILRRRVKNKQTQTTSKTNKCQLNVRDFYLPWCIWFKDKWLAVNYFETITSTFIATDTQRADKNGQLTRIGGGDCLHNRQRCQRPSSRRCSYHNNKTWTGLRPRETYKMYRIWPVNIPEVRYTFMLHC